MSGKGQRAVISALFVACLTLPLFSQSPYVLYVATLSAMYIAYALSFDLGAGHVGAISLAHPLFFGIGAYSVGILGTKANSPLWVAGLVAIVLAFLLAFLVARPAFRLKEISFAIATLGLALSGQLIALNWVEVTEGPGCINGIASPFSGWIGGENPYVANRMAFYYLFLVADLVVILVYVLLTRGRIGRVLTAIRNDEVLAASNGVDILRYKRFTFIAGACIASAIGALWAPYMTIVCPDHLGVAYTNTLLMIVFVGGAGNVWGVILGAVLVTVIPEVLRIEPTWRMELFGVVLLMMIIVQPNGLVGLFKRRRGGAMVSDTVAGHPNGEGTPGGGETPNGPP